MGDAFPEVYKFCAIYTFTQSKAKLYFLHYLKLMLYIAYLWLNVCMQNVKRINIAFKHKRLKNILDIDVLQTFDSKKR